MVNWHQIYQIVPINLKQVNNEKIKKTLNFNNLHNGISYAKWKYNRIYLIDLIDVIALIQDNT